VIFSVLLSFDHHPDAGAAATAPPVNDGPSACLQAQGSPDSPRPSVSASALAPLNQPIRSRASRRFPPSQPRATDEGSRNPTTCLPASRPCYRVPPLALSTSSPALSAARTTNKPRLRHLSPPTNAASLLRWVIIAGTLHPIPSRRIASHRITNWRAPATYPKVRRRRQQQQQQQRPPHVSDLSRRAPAERRCSAYQTAFLPPHCRPAFSCVCDPDSSLTTVIPASFALRVKSHHPLLLATSTRLTRLDTSLAPRRAIRHFITFTQHVFQPIADAAVEPECPSANVASPVASPTVVSSNPPDTERTAAAATATTTATAAAATTTICAKTAQPGKSHLQPSRIRDAPAKTRDHFYPYAIASSTFDVAPHT